MKSWKVYRLSPNEEASALKKNLEEKRRARLLQVREQERDLAHKMCQNVQGKRDAESRLLNDHTQASLANTHQKELEQLEVDYSTRVDQMGQGHRAAQWAMQDENRLEEVRLLLEAKQKWRAEARHQTAMKELILDQKYLKNKKDRFIASKNQVLEMEKERSRKIANKPLPAGQPLITNFTASKGHRVQFKEVDSYACTYYHLPHTVVQKDPPASQTALESALDRREIDEELDKHSVSTKLRQDEKAQIRHKYALAKVKLAKDRDEVMSQLKILEREDRTQRQKSLAGMPSNLFQPVHQRMETTSEQQKDMQQAFEKLLIQKKSEPRAELHTHWSSEPSTLCPSKDECETHVELPTDESSESSTLCPSKDGSEDIGNAGSKENTLHSSQCGVLSLQGSLTDDSSHTSSAGLAKNGDDSPTISDLIMPASLPSYGDVLRSKQPQLTSPPNPSKPANMKDALPSYSRYTTTNELLPSPPQKTCLTARFTQTERIPVYLPYPVTNQPVRPNLSFPDTTSSSISERSTKSRRQLYTLTEEASNSKFPKEKIPNEAMQKLVRMVRAQHEAWRETQSARLTRDSPPHSVQEEKKDQSAEQSFDAEEVVVHAPSTRVDATRQECGSESQEEASFSFSTCQHSVSAQHQAPPEAFSLTAEMAQVHQHDSMQPHILSHPSRRSATLSPPPLSISPYNTTLDAYSMREQSGSPDLYAAHYIGPDSFSMHSPKLSISPYNTTLESSYLDSDYQECSMTDIGTPHYHHQTGASNINMEGRPWGEHPDSSNKCQHYQAAGVDYSALDVRRDMSMSTMTATELYKPCLHRNHHSPLVPESSVHSDGHNEPSNRYVNHSDNPFSSLAYPPVVNMRPLLAPSLDVTLSSLAEQELTETGSKDQVNNWTSLWPVVQLDPSSHSLQSSNFLSTVKHPDTSAITQVKGQTMTVQKQVLAAQAGSSSSETMAHVASTPDSNIHGPSTTMSEEDEPLNAYYRISHPDPTAPELNLYEKHFQSSHTKEALPRTGTLKLDEEDSSSRPFALASDAHTTQPLTGFLPPITSPAAQLSSLSPPAATQTAGDGAEERFEPPQCSQDQHISHPPLQLQQEYGQSSDLSTALGDSQLEQFQVGCVIPNLHSLAPSSSGPLTQDHPFQVSSNIMERTSHHRISPLSTLNQPSMQHSHSNSLAHALPSTLGAGQLGTTQENNNGDLSESLVMGMSSGLREHDSKADENKTEGDFPVAHAFATCSSPRTSLLKANSSVESMAEQQQKKQDMVCCVKGSSLSLQEAVLLKKSTFISKSQNRMKSLKACAQQRQKTLHGGSRVQSTAPSTSRGKETFSEVRKSKKKTISSCSPKHLATTTGPTSLPTETIAHRHVSDKGSRQREVTKKKEMKERNSKLYKCLAEVKMKREKEERARAYAENRKKAKEYQQKLQEQSKMRRSVEHKPADGLNKRQVQAFK